MQIESESQHETTAEFAASLGCKPTTVHRSLCVNNHFLGIIPIKLPNGRLLWPISEKLKMLEEAKTA